MDPSNPLLSIVVSEDTNESPTQLNVPQSAPPLARKNMGHADVARALSVRPLNSNNPYQKRPNVCSSYHPNDSKNVSPFTQKIMSAKLLRFKQMQNQLAEMTLQINELLAENKVLKTLQRRQDNAIRKFEGSKEQLPQLIKSHNEEVRVINMKFKQLKSSHRDLEIKLKQKDTELMNLREQHAHLLHLSRDKHLGEREKLSKKLAEMETIVKEQNDKIIMLHKKLELQEKTYRHQLQVETQKHKETQIQLQSALSFSSNLKVPFESKEKVGPRRIEISEEHISRSGTSLPSPSRANLTGSQRNSQSETGIKGRQNGIKESPLSKGKVKNDKSSGETERRSQNAKSSPCNVSIRRPSVGRQKDVVKVPTTAVVTDRPDLNNRVSMYDPAKDTGAISSDSSDEMDERFKRLELELNSSTALDPNDVSSYVSSEESDSEHEHPQEIGSIKKELEKEIEIMMSRTRVTPEEQLRLIKKEKQTETLRQKTESDIEKLIDRACDGALSDDTLKSTSKQMDQLSLLSWEETQKEISPIKEELMKKFVPQFDANLNETEKTQLLKAMSAIDEEIKLKSNDSVPEPVLDERGVAKCYHIGTFAKSQKKKELMRTLFGSESEQLPVAGGQN